MTKIRYCKKDCEYPALKGRQFCEWHALLRESSDVQAKASKARLASAQAKDGHEHINRVSSLLWPSGERWCAGCQSYVPLFYTSGSRCKACASMVAHGRRLQEIYGITTEEYERILRLQGGRCAICRSMPRTIRLATDHDHRTGENRGLLCKRCNHDLLGGGHDSVQMLWRAISYLVDPPAQRVGPPLTREGVMSELTKLLCLADLMNQKTTHQEPPPF